jgi:hypothetical protein
MNGVSWGVVSCQHDSIVIVCSGRSLKSFDMNLLSGIGHIICVNNSYIGVPIYDAWFTLDPWGLSGGQLPKKGNPKLYAAVPQDFGTPHAKIQSHRINAPKNITYLHRLISHNNPTVSSETAYRLGLSEDPGCINTGNSGFGALNLAYHMKPKKILILGMDGDIGYYYSGSEKNRSLKFLPLMMESTVDQLKKANITVINGSLNSSITCFQKYTPEESVKIFKDI